MYDSNTHQLSAGEYTVPGNQVLQLIELLKFWRITGQDLLAGSGLDETQLEEPQSRLAVATMNMLIARARTLTGEPALGIFMGLSRRVSMYGFLGFAAMSAATLREAMELAVNFSTTVSTALRLSLHVEHDAAALRIEERADAGAVRDVVMLAFVIGMEQIGRALTGRAIPGSVDFAMPRPSYADRFPDLLASARFDQPVTQLLFHASALDLPLVAPDRAGLRLARQQCERALCDLGLDGAIVDQVRRLISRPEGIRGLDEVASCMRLSSRTLKRRLAAQGVTFSELVELERGHCARFLLRSSQLSLDEISERLGYSTVPNFARAFRRWTGQTPAGYRRAGLKANAEMPAVHFAMDAVATFQALRQSRAVRERSA